VFGNELGLSGPPRWRAKRLKPRPLYGRGVIEMDPSETCILETFDNLVSAELAKAFLESEGIDVTIDPSDPIAGPLGGFSSGIRIYVSEADKERARKILKETDLSDAELASLATAGQAEIDPIDYLAREWETRFPDLSGEWTHWYIEGEEALLLVVPGTDLFAALAVVRENHQRFASIYAWRARIDSNGETIREKRRVEISNRSENAQALIDAS
jgi:hypothetical protein